jgi:hypothetical protein
VQLNSSRKSVTFQFGWRVLWAASGYWLIRNFSFRVPDGGWRIGVQRLVRRSVTCRAALIRVCFETRRAASSSTAVASAHRTVANVPLHDYLVRRA